MRARNSLTSSSTKPKLKPNRVPRSLPIPRHLIFPLPHIQEVRRPIPLQILPPIVHRQPLIRRVHPRRGLPRIRVRPLLPLLLLVMLLIMLVLHLHLLLLHNLLLLILQRHPHRLRLLQLHLQPPILHLRRLPYLGRQVRVLEHDGNLHDLGLELRDGVDDDLGHFVGGAGLEGGVEVLV